LYNWTPGHDFGIAIILLTLLIRVILFPISVKALNSQKALQKLQPEIKKIQQQYKNEKEKQSKEILELYKKEKINPFSGLLLSLIQVPILIALYRVFWNGLNPGELSILYGFIPNPGQINAMFLHIIDLAKPNFLFAVLAGITQYFQTKMLQPKINPDDQKQNKGPDIAQAMQKQMLYFFPVFTVIILISLPSALGLYWIASAVFSIIQQYIILSKDNKPELIKK
jgi:YidC/Oxa1 family membrane protein insertase